MIGKQYEIPVAEIAGIQLLCRFRYMSGGGDLNLAVRHVELIVSEDILDACRQKAMAFVAEMAAEEDEG